MILCGGLQSSGSTLISWCFLQRKDTDGILDMPGDQIQTSFEKAKASILWCKMTIGSFRWSELFELYYDLCFQPEPLLVVRDLRTTFSSLMRKRYGVNGTTAEDPPLRMRFRRFAEDWQLFKLKGWPIVKFEDVIKKEKETLKKICQDLSLDWDEDMLGWPKKLSDIAYVSRLNETFASSIQKGTFQDAKINQNAQICINGLPQKELEWLERTFEEFNEYHDYPKKVEYAEGDETPMTLPEPKYEGTARDWIYKELLKYRNENYQFRAQIEKLLGEKKD
jgi:hypothetical protein